METFFDLHDRRFSGRGGSSLASDVARAFHADFAAAALERGWLRLWFLEFDGRPIASLYGWRVGDRYAYFNSGFDPGVARLRPGLVLLAGVIRSALEEGAAEFDLLLGDEAYKSRFAERARTVSDVTLARDLPHAASLVVGAEYGLRRVGRTIPASARRRLGLTRLARGSLLRGRGR
jgi:CelD/BcsL family acetyltransferase involved in cellulose biosynthesis